jgi:uncharacterized protein Yka (UPF0111/DUF47 family)
VRQGFVRRGPLHRARQADDHRHRVRASLRRFAMPPAMRRAIVCLSAAAITVLVVAAGAAAQMKASAPDKMMPAGEAAIMRECDRRSMAPGVKMQDRADFVKNCVAEKTKAKRP